MSNVRITALLVLVILMLAPLGSAQDQQVDRVRFNVLLTPSNETPPVTGIDAGGTAVVSFLLTHTPADDSMEDVCEDDDPDCETDVFADPDSIGEVTSATVDFLVNYAFGATESVRAMHIHRGVRGQGGPVEIGSDFGPEMAFTGSGSFYRSVVVTDPMALAVIQEILANPAGFYLNIHTQSSPSGLIRGQLLNTPEVISGRDGAESAAIQREILSRLNLIQATLEQIRVENFAQRETTNRIAAKLGVVPQSPDVISPDDLPEVTPTCSDEDEDGDDDDTGEPCEEF